MTCCLDHLLLLQNSVCFQQYTLPFMQVFLIAWCYWKKTRLTIKLLFISLCLQHFNPREEFPSFSRSFTSRYILTYLQRILKNIRINIIKMSNLSFNSSVQLYVGRETEVSISILSSSISSFIILYMKNQIYLETKIW